MGQQLTDRQKGIYWLIDMMDWLLEFELSQYLCGAYLPKAVCDSLENFTRDLLIVKAGLTTPGVLDRK